MRGWVTVVTGALLAALVVYAVLSNGQEVIVNLPFLAWPTKLWGAMVASAAIGAGLATLLFAWPLARAKLQTRRQGKRIAELEQEIHGLRTLPIASESVGAGATQKS